MEMKLEIKEELLCKYTKYVSRLARLRTLECDMKNLKDEMKVIDLEMTLIIAKARSIDIPFGNSITEFFKDMPYLGKSNLPG